MSLAEPDPDFHFLRSQSSGKNGHFFIFFACPRETLSRKNTHIFFCFGCKNSRFLWAMFICSFGGASDRGPYFTLLNFGEILLREGVNDSPKGCPSLLELGTCALASTRDYL